MSFLEPIYLFLAGAVAVPLLLHLLRRRIGLRIEFPAARYIARAERENSRKLRLRNLLLMFVRLAAVLVIAAAAARPVGRLVGAGHVPTALALVLDNSLSTSTIVDGSPLFARLRAAALSAARRANASDRLWVITADGRVVGGSRGAVIEAIERAEPLSSRGDPQGALTRAVGLVRASGLTAQHVAVVTDGQATAWTSTTPLGDARVTLYVPPARPPANHAVSVVEARPTRWTPRGSVVARAIGADSTTYRLAIAGPGGAPRTLARGTVTGSDEILVRASPSERGWLAGSIELEPDELRGDDVRHFAVWLGVAPAVALDPTLGSFAQSAIDALVQSERLRPGADVAIVPADALTRLPALIVAPADPVRIGAANRALERTGVPWRFGAARRDQSTVRERAASFQALEGATVTLRYSLTSVAAATADTLARVGDEPWVVAGDRYVIIASPLDPGATNLPVRAGFLPWLADAVSQRLSGDAGTAIEAVPGARVRIPEGVQALEDVSGVESPIDARQPTAPERPGVYFLKRGDARVGAIVVNAEADESHLDRLSTAALRRRFEGGDVNVHGDAERWADDAFNAAATRPLVTPLLLLALAVLVAETLLARSGGRPATARAAA